MTVAGEQCPTPNVLLTLEYVTLHGKQDLAMQRLFLVVQVDPVSPEVSLKAGDLPLLWSERRWDPRKIVREMPLPSVTCFFCSLMK